uniref:Uncharacterized protein n=1 Tax=Romanomermis culicivorax TaxID=13658 RepID=A0A915K261_ROMCU
EPKCEQVKPFICNGQVTGCPQGTWLAGVTSYQLDTSGTPDLLVPTCCSAENVKIEDCVDRRLNSVNSRIDNTLNDDEIYQSFTCLPLSYHHLMKRDCSSQAQSRRRDEDNRRRNFDQQQRTRQQTENKRRSDWERTFEQWQRQCRN